ncbi:MAB_1171c family putative transporter [Catellatospora sp. NPDC049133]|uniref:MAB_1171c family putative transporter n=1 Tax=Catellatospora sp. NPDC049133 TaxID=3155499 RepID=UPI0033C5EA1E
MGETEDAVYPVIAVITWLVTLRMLITQFKEPTLQRGFLIAAIGIPGFSYWTAAPRNYHWFNDLVGVPNLGVLVVYCGVMTFAYGIVAFLMAVVRGREYLVRRIWYWTAGYVLAVAVMAVLFVLAPVDVVDAEGSTGFDQMYAAAPYVPWLLIIFQLYFAAGLIALSGYCWTWSRQLRDRPFMQRGLAFIGVGSALGLLYVVPKIVYVVIRQSGPDLVALNTWAPLGAVGASLCYLVGFSLCAMGWFTEYRERWSAYQRIHPLWTELVDPFQGLVLRRNEGPKNPRRALHPARLKTLVYRRVVELRDVRLMLRAWFDPTVAASARAEAQAAGLKDMSADAYVEAALLRAALAAHRPEAEPPTTADPHLGGDAIGRWLSDPPTLGPETRWWSAVAGHYLAADAPAAKVTAGA